MPAQGLALGEETTEVRMVGSAPANAKLRKEMRGAAILNEPGHQRKGEHVLLNLDVMEGLRRIPDGSVDLVFVDPPYNIGKNFRSTRDQWESDEAYLNWCYVWLEACISKMKPTASMYLMSATQNMPYLDVFLRSRLTILSRIVWHYDSSGVQARRYFGSLYEPILFAVKDPENYVFNADAIAIEARTGAVRKLIDYRKSTPAQYSAKKVPGNVWYVPRVRYRMPEYEDHPSQKPEALLERIIAASSTEGDVVLDPFAGVFTTCAVAKRLGRESIGIEIDQHYYAVGLRRLGLTQPDDPNYSQPLDKAYQRKNGGSPIPDLFSMTDDAT
jgi:adenine-specific DNA-methyltransferase